MDMREEAAADFAQRMKRMLAEHPERRMMLLKAGMRPKEIDQLLSGSDTSNLRTRHAETLQRVLGNGTARRPTGAVKPKSNTLSSSESPKQNDNSEMVKSVYSSMHSMAKVLEGLCPEPNDMDDADRNWFYNLTQRIRDVAGIDDAWLARRNVRPMTERDMKHFLEPNQTSSKKGNA